MAAERLIRIGGGSGAAWALRSPNGALSAHTPESGERSAIVWATLELAAGSATVINSFYHGDVTPIYLSAEKVERFVMAVAAGGREEVII